MFMDESGVHLRCVKNEESYGGLGRRKKKEVTEKVTEEVTEERNGGEVQP